MPTPTLPPLPPVPAPGFFVLMPNEWAWLVKVLEATYAALGTIHSTQETIMATAEELQASLDRNTADTNAAAAAIGTEIDQLKAAIAALTPGDPVSQAQLDQLNASSDKLEAATASLAGDDTVAPAPVDPNAPA